MENLNVISGEYDDSSIDNLEMDDTFESSNSDDGFYQDIYGDDGFECPEFDC